MSIYIYVLVMAVTTYLIRALPLTLFKKPIRSRYLRSFLHYVPTACLTAMTFPAILTATDHVISRSNRGCCTGLQKQESDRSSCGQLRHRLSHGTTDTISIKNSLLFSRLFSFTCCRFPCPACLRS